MKATLEFNLPEEQEEYNIFNNALGYNSACRDFDQWLRSEIKHNNKDWQEIRNRFDEFLSDNQIYL